MSAARRCDDLPSTLPAPASGIIRARRRARDKWIEQCPACEGYGHTTDVDYDDDDKRLVVVMCEFCEGSGQLANCVACDEIMSAPEADSRGYVCAHCTEQLG